MQSIDLGRLERMGQEWESLLRDSEDARRELHKRMAAAAKGEVDSAVAGSLNDSRGNIRAWQEARVGSKGGYAAISAAKSPGGANGAGAVTNYLENGHRVRAGAQGRKGYRPRATTVRVNGRHFYRTAQNPVEAAAYREAEKFADDLAQKLEGT